LIKRINALAERLDKEIKTKDSNKMKTTLGLVNCRKDLKTVEDEIKGAEEHNELYFTKHGQPEEIKVGAELEEGQPTALQSKNGKTGTEQTNEVTARQAVEQLELNSKNDQAEKFGHLIGKKSAEYISQAEKFIQKIGAGYNKIPLKYKLALSVALIGGAPLGAALAGASFATVISAALAGSTNVAGIVISKRAVSSVGAYVALQGVINKSLNEGLTKKGKAKVEKEGKNLFWLTKHPKIYSALLSGIVVAGGSFASSYLVASEKELGSMTASKEGKRIVAGFIEKNYPPLDPPKIIPDVAMVESQSTEIIAENIHNTKKGETLYQIIRENFPEIKSFSGGRQANIIETILTQIKDDPHAVGITSNDVNQIAVGDEINLDKIKEILKSKEIGGENLIDHAKNLSDKVVADIETYSSDVSTNVDAPTQVEIDSSYSSGQELIAKESLDSPEMQGTPILENDKTTPSQEASFEKISITATQNINKDLDLMFGSAGLLGIFGRKSGKNSPWWKEFSRMKASDIISTDPKELVREDKTYQKYFKLIHRYLQTLAERTLIPTSEESTAEFVVRAHNNLVKNNITI
jgi:hypothetical protein